MSPKVKEAKNNFRVELAKAKLAFIKKSEEFEKNQSRKVQKTLRQIKSPDIKNKKSRSRSPNRRNRIDRSPDRRNKKSERKDRRNRRSSSRSPDRRHRRSRQSRSRSRSKDRSNIRSRSKERELKEAVNLERSTAREKRVGSRSPSNETKSNKRKRCDNIERISENSLSDTDIATLDEENIKIISVITPILKECGGKNHVCDSFKLVYRFKRRQRARVVYKLLNNFRTPLGRAKLVCSRKVDTLIPDDLQETMLVMRIINETLKKSQQFNIEILNELSKLTDKIDPYLFKTKKCVPENCRNIKKCICYHNDEQIRRNPARILYNPTVCSQYRLGSCILGSRCEKCHSEYEFIFHPDRVHKKVCSDWYIKGPCKFDYDSTNCCINAHPETPEVLFNEVWCDLYITDLKHTYQYLVGAIHNLRFLNTQSQGVYILLITPSIYMTHWLIGATKSLATALKLDVHMVTSDSAITEKEKQSKVLLCTPSGAIRFLETPGVELGVTLAGLILDDVTLLLHRHKNELDTIGKALVSSTIGLCRVAVADKVYKQDVDDLSELLYTQFNIVGPIISSKQEKGLPSSSTIDSILSASKNIRQAELTQSTVTVAQRSNSDSTDVQMNPNKSPLVEACQFLMGFSDKIGILGHSLKAALEKAHIYENDCHKILESLCESESQELLVLIVGKFKRMREETQDSILLAEYIQACIATNFLMESTKSHLETSKDLDKMPISLESSEKKSQFKSNVVNMSSTASRMSVANRSNVSDTYDIVSRINDVGLRSPTSRSYVYNISNVSDIYNLAERNNVADIGSTANSSRFSNIRNDANISNTVNRSNDTNLTSIGSIKCNASRSTDANIRHFSNINNIDGTSDVITNQGSDQKIDFNKLSQEEVMLIKKLLGKHKDSNSSLSPSRALQRSEETQEIDYREASLKHPEKELLSKSPSYVPSTISSMLDEIGEPLDLNMSLNLPRRNYEQVSGIERRLDDTTQSFQIAGYSQSCSDSSQRFMNGVFKVAIFGHEYVDLLPFYTGETFKSKTPDNSYQVIKYARRGAEILKVTEYSIWNEVISSQPHMIFLILGKYDISPYTSPQELADRMIRIKTELEKNITNVRIVCFGLEKHQSDYRWNNYQDKLNRFLGAGFDIVIFPTPSVDIGNKSYEAMKQVWSYMQGFIEDLQLQEIMLRQLFTKLK